ncbi:MAG: LCP family protein, partial [Demequinaceae bacterium]|nr:LCP family protein [Demequinaceae bacterium]
SEYIVVDFVGVQNIITVLGGVPMCIPFDVSSPKAGLKLKAGPQVLNGWQAVAWARARTMEFTSTADRIAFEAVYGSNGNDLYRIKRQHELVGKVFEVALSQNLFFHPTQMTDLFLAAADSMTVSPNMKELDFLVGLAWSLRHIDKSNIVFTTVPSITNPKDSNTLVWSSKADALFTNIINDQPISGSSVADMSDSGPVPNPSTSTGTDPNSSETTDLLGACTVG